MLISEPSEFQLLNLIIIVFLCLSPRFLSGMTLLIGSFCLFFSNSDLFLDHSNLFINFFGLFSDLMAGKPPVMAALTGTLIVILAIMTFRARYPIEQVGFSLIVGGALGNVIDRLRQGAVTDFVDLAWQSWRWPTFNAADIAITVGALCILFAAFSSHRSKESVVDQS